MGRPCSKQRAADGVAIGSSRVIKRTMMDYKLMKTLRKSLSRKKAATLLDAIQLRPLFLT